MISLLKRERGGGKEKEGGHGERRERREVYPYITDPPVVESQHPPLVLVQCYFSK